MAFAIVLCKGPFTKVFAGIIPGIVKVPIAVVVPWLNKLVFDVLIIPVIKVKPPETLNGEARVIPATFVLLIVNAVKFAVGATVKLEQVPLLVKVCANVVGPKVKADPVLEAIIEATTPAVLINVPPALISKFPPKIIAGTKVNVLLFFTVTFPFAVNW